MKKAIPIIATLSLLGSGVSTGFLAYYFGGESNIRLQEENSEGVYVCVSISSPNDEASISLGETLQLEAVVTRNGSTSGVDQSVVWESSNEAVATIDQTGFVNTHGAGLTNLKATSVVQTAGAPDDIGTASYTLQVTPVISASGYATRTATHLPYEGAPEGVAITGITNPDILNTPILYLPSVIDGKPVYEIGALAFSQGIFVREIFLPDSLIYIGGFAFSGCTSLEIIHIPSSIQAGGYVDNFLTECPGLKYIDVAPGGAALKSVNGVLFSANGKKLLYYPSSAPATTYTIPAGVETVSNYSFIFCKYLRTVNMSNSVTSIGEQAFYNSVALQTVNLSTNITTIEDGAFAATGIRSITIPFGVTTIGSQAFAACPRLETVNLPTTLRTIESYAFAGCPTLRSISLPAGLLEIGVAAFLSCTALKDISLPSSLTTIRSMAFTSCSALTTITLPSFLISLGNNAFVGANALKAINVTTNPNFSSVDGVLYSGNTLLVYPAGKPGVSFAVPSGTTAIGESAFSGVQFLETITIPTTVNTISFSGIENSPLLKAINVTQGNTAYSSINGVVFDTAMTTIFAYPAGKTDTSYIIPNTISKIASYAFDKNPFLQTLTIPNSVLEIGNYALSFLSNLTTLNMSTALTSIGVSAISDNPSLVSLTFPATLVSIGSYSLKRNTSLVAINVNTSNSIFSSADGVLYENDTATLLVYPAMRPSPTYVVPNNIEVIDGDAIYGTKFLQNLTIGSSITSLADNLITNNSALETITLPAGLQIVDGNSFHNNPAMREYIVSASNPLFYTNDGVLYAKESAITVLLSYPAGKTESHYQIMESTTLISSRAFDSCQNLASIAIPGSVLGVMDYAFANCTNLAYLVIPRSLALLSPNAFADSAASLFFEAKTLPGGAVPGFNPNANPVYLGNAWYYADYTPIPFY